MPLAQVQDAVTGLVTGCKELGIQFAIERPTIYHAGNVQNVREQFVSASKKAGYGPQNPPELVVTFVCTKFIGKNWTCSLTASGLDRATGAHNTIRSRESAM